MAIRKGLGKGRGKGYRNIISRDPRVHSDSSRGRKQPQRIKEQMFIRVDVPKKADRPFLLRQDALNVIDQHLKSKGINKLSESEKRNLLKSWDSDRDGVPDKKDCRPFDSTKQDILIKREDVDYDVPFDWKKLTYTDKLKLVQEAGLQDSIASTPLDQLTIFQVKELTEALVRRKYASEKELKKIRERNIQSRQEGGSGFFESELDKAKGIKQYSVVPPKEEVQKLVSNLIDIENGRKVLKMPGSSGDYKVTYDFKGFTKSGNVILQERPGQGGRKKILKPYVFNSGLYVAIWDGTGTQILNLQTGR